MEWFTTNWPLIVSALWSIDQILKVVAAMTDNKVIDNLADGFGKLLSRFLPKAK